MTRDLVFMLCLSLAAAPASAATTTSAGATGQTTTAATAPKASAASPAAGAKRKARSAGTHRASAPRAESQTAPSQALAGTARAAADSSMSMHGGQEGTVFKSLTVQGEDRIRLDFERPPLDVALDPAKAPGLDWGSARDVLDRTTPDLATPLVMSSARDASPYLGHPWLSHFASGAVARFQPEVKDVVSWKLSIVNARGETVTSFSGKGEPPHTITWDGRSSNGTPVVPGLTYSYVLEARDKAGNKRNFVGQGFRVSAYRFENADGPTMSLTARELPPVAPGRSTAGTAAPPILIEAASWLNQRAQPTQPVRVTVAARNLDEAQALADFVTRSMSPYLIGDPARLQAVTEVQADAPEGGTIRITPSR